MKTWRTRLQVKTSKDYYRTDEINIRKGIFQGDKLSTLWFCLAINFLSKLLNESSYGYVIEKNTNVKINHLLYIDDLKLFAANEEQLLRQLKIVTSFTRTIRMELGIDKCAVVHVKRGKLSEGDTMMIQDDFGIQTLTHGDTYKYLGVQQGMEIRTNEARETFKYKFLNRFKKILQANLNAKAMNTAISSWAIPCLSYSFGVVKWTASDLKTLDIQTRKLPTRHGMHHPNASVNRLYIPRKDGGRGMQSIESIHHTVVKDMREYFRSKDLPFYKALSKEDQNITALNMASEHYTVQHPTTEELTEVWHNRALHGRYPAALKKRSIDKERSVKYLQSGYLFPTTEGRLAAIQDQVVATRSYQKNILGKNLTGDRCRKCSRAPETIQHVTSSCPVLAPREYTDRHNAMAKVFHQAISLKYGLINTSKKIHEYLPREIQENDEVKVYWDHPLTTDRPLAHNRPDIVVFKKREAKAIIVDITVPADDNAEKAYTEKVVKYQDLAFELKELYRLANITILPLVITTSGLIEVHLMENTTRLGLEERLIEDAQKEVILWTTRIVRRFLMSE
ncbi:uncharacterized protein LOC123311659 [Coccinella septempunctata]|uniref:uncharacterized protein LOC123311659 n=1 Tax=Coccinella septempunctata TaxID=41139 RepID=UPI001D093391|nr:uncharacterized protein LOC123311659 [Coccinella septempunctata]